MIKKIIFVVLLVLYSLMAVGCSHKMEVKNLNDFSVPVSFGNSGKRLNLGLKSFNGDSESAWYFNIIAKDLNSRHEIRRFKTDYTRGRCDFKPDYIILINIDTKYKSTPLNFFITCPGSFIFAPAWNGHVYYANITTSVTILDGSENELKKIHIDTPYSMRFAEFDRTWWPIFSWNILSPIGGVYSACLYDPDATINFQNEVQTNYSSYITDRIVKEIEGLSWTSGGIMKLPCQLQKGIA